MVNNQKAIIVYENWSGTKPVRIGWLYVNADKGTEHYSFEYDDDWIKESGFAFVLDPDLSQYAGRQYPAGKDKFGLFTDSAPDRWGRTLMDRRERMLAQQEGRKPRKLYESDYLIGVYDETRMGALRFKTEEDGDYLSNDREVAASPWTSLRTLEEASREFEKDKNLMSPIWLNQLIRPGSSLGGARPKAGVIDEKGELWIAKFPSKNDEVDIGAWEKVTHDLAKMCKLKVPESKMKKFSDLGSTFLVKRFDRSGHRRIHFASAMTMLHKTDGASAQDGTGYLDILSFIRSNGAEPAKDAKELWRRIVFNMAVSNTDDHLRNHGFLLSREGWRLSPLYDVNPSPFGDSLALNVSDTDNSISIELALEISEYFGFSLAQARQEVEEMIKTIGDNWRRIAEQYKLSHSSIEYMQPAFALCE